ncbi:hypothetical protein EBR96_00025 [bacterium]|nr:hypothetical protein [bacterium]
MLSGQEKAKMLLSMLGDRATSVLSLLSPSNASRLTSTIGDSPKASPAVMNSLVSEIMEKVERSRSGRLLSSGPEVADADSNASFMGSLDGLTDSSSLSSGDLFGGGDSSGDSSVFGGGFGGFGDESASEETESNDGTPQGPRMRAPSEIADLLAAQKPQLAAFILSRLDDSLRESVSDALDYNLKTQLESIRVDKVPLSDSVFQKIYDKVVLAPEVEEDADGRGSGLDSGFSSGFGSGPGDSTASSESVFSFG